MSKESAHYYTPMDSRSNEYELDHIYEMPGYGDGMKPNDYEHFYEPTAANWFICYMKYTIIIVRTIWESCYVLL